MRELVGAADTVRDALAVQADAATLADTLDVGDRHRLCALTERLRAAGEESPWLLPGPDERARAEAFADMLERLPAPDKRSKRELRLLAQYTRRIQRLPSPAERGVFAAAGESSTLEQLAGDLEAAAAESAPPSAGVWWGNLERGEQREFEELVEKIVGAGFFARRRGQEAAALGIDVLARWAEQPPPLRSLTPEGAAVMPAGVFADVLAGRLIGVDVGVLAVVLLAFATRRVHPAVALAVTWTDDGATLQIRGSGLHRLLPTWTDDETFECEPVVIGRDAIAGRLAATGWLVVDKSRDEVRVRLGPRLLETSKAQTKQKS